MKINMKSITLIALTVAADTVTGSTIRGAKIENGRKLLENNERQLDTTTHHRELAQQQWASQYMSWKLDDSQMDVWNVDQQVHILQGNTDHFWPLQFGFKGAGYGGYLGFQQQAADGEDETRVRFSLWNAINAIGDNCRTFGGEGVGYTCTLPMTFDSEKSYKVRLWKTATEADGQFWGAWLIETDGNDTVEHHIGEIKVPLSCGAVDPNSLTNFVEYYGPAMNVCEDVPMSVAMFDPPTVNNGGNSATYNGSSKAGGNLCVTGQEGNGALVTTFTVEESVAMVLGGSSDEHVAAVPPPTTDLPSLTVYTDTFLGGYTSEYGGQRFDQSTAYDICIANSSCGGITKEGANDDDSWTLRAGCHPYPSQSGETSIVVGQHC